MTIDVLLGLQWGDEGKGKIVDVLTPNYDIIARFQGGPNAGHTLFFNQHKYTLHLIPSGIFRPGTINIIGNGVVLDPIIFSQEIKNLSAAGHDLTKNLLIARKAHLILPTHRILDAASEKSKGTSKIGSTLKGIGPAYMDKTGRNGLRVGDIYTADFKQKFEFLKNKHLRMLEMYDFEFDAEQFEKEWFEGTELLKTFEAIDCEHYLAKALSEGKKILAEGAQGTMLDVDYGSYPFVTSSNTVCAGACTGLGISPKHIGEVFGIFKAYATRVGSGPFPTELFDETGKLMRDIGNEYGSTTGRERRCGWLDLPALKYAVFINGATQLIMMKSDVLNSFEKVKIATAYEKNGKVIDYIPFETDVDLKPIYKEFPGWNYNSVSENFEDFPEEFKNYVAFIENELKVPIKVISYGPDRTQTIFR